MEHNGGASYIWIILFAFIFLMRGGHGWGHEGGHGGGERESRRDDWHNERRFHDLHKENFEMQKEMLRGHHGFDRTGLENGHRIERGLDRIFGENIHNTDKIVAAIHREGDKTRDQAREQEHREAIRRLEAENREKEFRIAELMADRREDRLVDRILGRLQPRLVGSGPLRFENADFAVCGA